MLQVILGESLGKQGGFWLKSCSFGCVCVAVLFLFCNQCLLVLSDGMTVLLAGKADK